MVTKNLVKLPKSSVEVQISLPWADVEPKWNETLQRLAAEVELPGFRKGQAPLPMVEQHLGSKLQDEVFKVVFPQALIEALQGSDIVPIDYPKYQLVSFTKGQQLSFKALVTNRPEVKVGEYKNLVVPRPVAKPVTDQEVDKVIEDLYKRWQSRQAQGGRPQATGQQASGQPSSVQPGPAPTGAGSMTFGAQPPTPQTSQITTSAATGMPNDDFAKALGTQNLADLKTKIKADLENEVKVNEEMDYEGKVLEELANRTEVDVPDVLIEDELHRMLLSYQKQVTDMGFIFDEYLKSRNETIEGLRQKWLPLAVQNMKMELGLAEIARMENIQISDSELQAEIDKVQDARMKAQFQAQEPRLHLRHSLRQLKTLDFIKSLVKSS